MRIKTKGAKRGRDEPTSISGDNETSEPPYSHHKGGDHNHIFGWIVHVFDRLSLDILNDSRGNMAK